jgi:hypothetical protein
MSDYPEAGGEAYKQGLLAYKAGAPYLSNPHPRYTYNWEQWRKGYMSKLILNKDKEVKC